MIIECPHCNAFVDAKPLGEKTWGPDEHGNDPRKVVLLECPKCDSALLGHSEIAPDNEGNWDWDNRPTRLWPKPAEGHHFSIPREVRKALADGRKCFDAGVYSAAAVMAGRAIEAIAKEKVGAATLAKGLEKMKTQGIIDEKIWAWGNALREERNMGAHATGVDVHREDAEDILAFAEAICDYVYVLAQQFDEYMKRKGKA